VHFNLAAGACRLRSRHLVVEEHVAARGSVAGGILVVDDEALARDALIEFLQGEGYDARGATNGFEALRMLRDGYKPALVLLDMMMGQMDGWDFRRAQQRDPALAEIPVVVLTAVVDPDLEARKLHAVAGFRKPFNVYSLLKVVSEYCSRSR